MDLIKAFKGFLPKLSFFNALYLTVCYKQTLLPFFSSLYFLDYQYTYLHGDEEEKSVVLSNQVEMVAMHIYQGYSDSYNTDWT